MTAPWPGVPWYVHPALDPDGWSSLSAAVGEQGFVVANVHNGPGRADDPYYGPVLANLRHLGYVDLDYGRRPLTRVLADVRQWLQQYGSVGVMLDQAPSTAGPWLTEAVARVRGEGAGTVVGNPGVVAASAVMELFDVVCVFEGTAECYLKTEAPLGVAAAGHRTWHLVYGCPASLRRCVVRCRSALRRGAWSSCT